MYSKGISFGANLWFRRGPTIAVFDSRILADPRLPGYNRRLSVAAYVADRTANMEKNDLLRYKNLLLAKRQEMSNAKSLADSIPTASDYRGDPVDVAASQTDAAT